MTKAILIKNTPLHPLSLLDRLTKDFIQEDYIFSHDFNNSDILLKRMEALSHSSSGVKLPVITIYPGGDCSFINTLKEKSKLIENISNTNTLDRNLTVLKLGILEPVLGLSPTEDIETLDDIVSALKAVDQGGYEVVFIIND